MSFKYECKNNLLLVSRLCYFFASKYDRKQKALVFLRNWNTSNHVVTIFYLGKESFIKQRQFLDKSFSNVLCCLCRILHTFLSHIHNKDAFTKSSLKITQNCFLIFLLFLLI